MSPEEARLAALRAFGNPLLLRDQTRATWSWNGIGTIRARSSDRSSDAASDTGICHYCDSRHDTRHRRQRRLVHGRALGPAQAAALSLIRPTGFVLSSYEHSHVGLRQFPTTPSPAAVYAEWKKRNQTFGGMMASSRASRYNLSADGGESS